MFHLHGVQRRWPFFFLLAQLGEGERPNAIRGGQENFSSLGEGMGAEATIYARDLWFWNLKHAIGTKV